MNKAKPSPKPAYRSDLRHAQAGLTRDKIQRAAAALLEERGAAEGITFKAVAERAGVTEMTVYRHFPTREALLEGLWRHLNDKMAPDLGMPDSAEALLAQHDALFAGFDRIAPQIVASITSPQGREMRASLNKQRRKAFLAIIEAAAPGLDPQRKTAAAAVLQLLHSAYAWDSLREQWGLNGKAAGKATKWAIEALLNDVRRASP
ncbi:MAG: TetR/AcrR family transcriptional regulator [Hyphomonadaceae bacterium]|nr:TetR/AcrR family transcriptional regulator [Hyphomonadaceae bacterium]